MKLVLLICLAVLGTSFSAQAEPRRGDYVAIAMKWQGNTLRMIRHSDDDKRRLERWASSQFSGGNWQVSPYGGSCALAQQDRSYDIFWASVSCSSTLRAARNAARDHCEDNANGFTCSIVYEISAR